MKRIEPSKSLLQGMPYTNAANTDIRARFDAIKAAQQKPAEAAPNVSPLHKRKHPSAKGL